MSGHNLDFGVNGNNQSARPETPWSLWGTSSMRSERVRRILSAAASACRFEALERRVLFANALPSFQPVAPLGSLAYSSVVSDAIGFAGETDSFTFAADPGQRVTVVAEPLSAGLNVN